MSFVQIFLLYTSIYFAIGINGQYFRPFKYQEPEPRFVRLGRFNVNRDLITLSGFSSGGTFAQQLQISYSSLFSGIASFSHAYYRCGPGTGREAEYDDACTVVGDNSQNSSYNPELALADIRNYERQGLIESTQNLRNKRLYLYAGSRSSFFDLDQSLGAVRIYEPLIQNINNIQTRVQDAEQLLPTKNFGARCTENAADSFFLGNCGFSGAYEALKFLLGDIIRSPQDGLRPNPNNLMAFDQTEFYYGFEGEHLMDSLGYIYVPRHCLVKTCFLHFYFHGCLSGRNYNETGTNHLVNSGYLELAEANDLILVAPQAVGNEENQIECWDTYGLTGRLYATQRGAQVTVVRNMLARILGEDSGNEGKVQSAGQRPVPPPKRFEGNAAGSLGPFEITKAVNNYYKVDIQYQ